MAKSEIRITHSSANRPPALAANYFNVAVGAAGIQLVVGYADAHDIVLASQQPGASSVAAEIIGRFNLTPLVFRALLQQIQQMAPAVERLAIETGSLTVGPPSTTKPG